MADFDWGKAGEAATAAGAFMGAVAAVVLGAATALRKWFPGGDGKTGPLQHDRRKATRREEDGVWMESFRGELNLVKSELAAVRDEVRDDRRERREDTQRVFARMDEMASDLAFVRGQMSRGPERSS